VNEAQATEVLALLRAIAAKLGARAPSRRPPAGPEERALWRRSASSVTLRRGGPSPEPVSDDPLPPSGGVDPEAFFARRESP